MTRIAILQSNYIPWKGVFDLINQVDCFVFLEDVQFTKRDWRTRNYIKTSQGRTLLSVPVKKEERGTLIHGIQISQETAWQVKHYETLKRSYGKAPFYKQYNHLLKNIYLDQKWDNLSEFNVQTTTLLCETLGIKTELYNSQSLNTEGNKDDKIISICSQLDGSSYLSGPAARNYIQNDKFIDAGIQLEYIVYDYPEYPQLYGEFEHFVSVLDVLFNCGEQSRELILQGNRSKAF